MTSSKRAKQAGIAQAVRLSTPSRAEARKGMVVQAAIEILATEGIDSLTFDNIGKRTKMSRSHVVYYFKSRDRLIEETVRAVTVSAKQEIGDFMGQPAHWRQALERYVEGNFHWIENNPDHASVYTLMYYLASFRPIYRKLHLEIRKVGSDWIEALLRQAPEFSKANVTDLAKNIQGLVTGNIIEAVTTPGRRRFEVNCSRTQTGLHALLSSAHQ
jgi:AcrR family transcriptional regulator